jgi:hypothetical protein
MARKRGRELGYPTANIVLIAGSALAHGIYATTIKVGDQVYPSVSSYGRRPTFGDKPPLLEVHLFDFSGDLYGQSVEVAFHAYLRPELKFDGVEALIAQMDKDSAAGPRRARRRAAALAARPGARPRPSVPPWRHDALFPHRALVRAAHGLERCDTNYRPGCPLRGRPPRAEPGCLVRPKILPPQDDDLKS